MRVPDRPRARPPLRRVGLVITLRWFVPSGIQPPGTFLLARWKLPSPNRARKLGGTSAIWSALVNVPSTEPTTLDRVAHVVLSGRRLTATAHRVLLGLLVHSNRSGASWPSVGRLSVVLGIGTRQTRKGLAELQSAGLVHSCDRGRGGSALRVLAPAASRGDLARLHRPQRRAPDSGGAAVGAAPPPAPPRPQAVPAQEGGVSQRTGGGCLSAHPERGSRTREEQTGAGVSKPHQTGRRWSPSKRIRTREVTVSVLKSPGALLDVLGQSRPMSESERLRALSAARYALREGRNPAALFTHLLRPGSEIPLADEDAARLQLRRVDGLEPERPKARGWQRVSPGLRVRVPDAGATPIGELLRGAG